MKKIDIGQTFSILANIGVIAGIIFLAVEISQNNALLEAQAGYNLARNRASNAELLKTSPEFAELLVKLAEGQPLTPQEEQQEKGFYISFMVNWAWEFNEHKEGRIDESQLPVRAWADLMRGEGPVPTPGLMEAWAQQSIYYDQEFVDFVNVSVIPAE